VLPDVSGIDRTFDYLVPAGLEGRVGIGTRVRVSLHGRRVGGWVVADRVTPPAGVDLHSISSVTGLGPPADIVELAGWASWRWAGRTGAFLTTASPPRVVRELPSPGRAGNTSAAAVVLDDLEEGLVEDALADRRSVVRVPPAVDPFPLVEAAVATCTSGDGALVLAPSQDWAARTADRLGRRGHDVALLPEGWAYAAAGGRVTVGTRSAAWAPVPQLSVVVVVDAHDEAHGEQRAPTWNAVVVAAERAERSSARCLLISPCPTLEALAWGRLVAGSRRAERQGWATLEVVDRRKEDPRSGLFSERLVRLIRAARPAPADRVVCVLNRTGRGRLLACATCGELGRCERCEGPLAQTDATEIMRCRRCGHERPNVCAACGSQRWRVLRPGVSKVREELEALAGVPVREVSSETADSDGALDDAAVTVGTEAVLHRFRGAGAVVFLDFDQELLAPRYRAGEQALALLARASRVVGGRTGRGRVLVQTRLPGNEVIDAALHADPGRLAAVDAERRSALGLPPATALALVSGQSAGAYVEGLATQAVDVLGPDGGRWLVRAPDHQTLCDALAGVRRPTGRLRIEVDPTRA
jgi:primosomal protein N' (replication factor Y)